MEQTYKQLYHITSQNNLSEIFSEGLVPSIGTNSFACYEKEKRVYLTDIDSVPYWCILLGVESPVLLEVRDVTAEKFQYSYYAEYTTAKTISPKNISLANQFMLQFDKNKYMKKLCETYIETLSHICLWLIRAYTYDTVNDVCFDEISALLNAVDRLDYSCASQQEWRRIVQDYGESGEYTFCDHYSYKQKSGPKLFEQITLFPEDKHLSLRQQVANTITNLFPDCKNWETGGWTG